MNTLFYSETVTSFLVFLFSVYRFTFNLYYSSIILSLYFLFALMGKAQNGIVTTLTTTEQYFIFTFSIIFNENTYNRIIGQRSHLKYRFRVSWVDCAGGRGSFTWTQSFPALSWGKWGLEFWIILAVGRYQADSDFRAPFTTLERNLIS